MKVLSAKINWHEEYSNEPTLEITVDSIPKDSIYLDRDPYYFSEKEGYVNYLYHDSRDETGYGGSVFTLKTDKGSKTVKGPWSSRANVFNALVESGKDKYKDFKACKECHISDKNCPIGAAITLDLYFKILKDFELDAWLDLVHDVSETHDVYVYKLSRVIEYDNGILKHKIGLKYAQSQAYKDAQNRLKMINNWKYSPMMFDSPNKGNTLLKQHKEVYNNIILNNDLEKFGFMTFPVDK